MRFARALAIEPPATRAALYRMARTVFVSAHEQLPEFDRVFAAVFDGLVDPADSRGDPNAPPLPGEARRRRGPSRAPVLPEPRSGGAAPSVELSPPPEGEAEEERTLPLAAASSQERLAERDFAELDADELQTLRSLMRDLALAPPLRLTRRRRRDRHGRHLDVRATLRASARTGGDPSRRVRRHRVERPRQVVLLCDISGSMEPYARALLRFVHAAVAGRQKVEAFAIGTRLTRMTRELQSRDPDVALAHASERVMDWSGGTRLGDGLRRFNDDWGVRGLARGAIVVILSDGWDRGDPAVLGEQMARLARVAYRIVWVNPLKATPEYAPLARGMAAALPHVDEFVEGHSLASLEHLVEVIGR